MQTHEWEEWLYEAPEDHLPGKEAVAEVIRLRKAVEALRDRHLARIAAADYITAELMDDQSAADDLTRILEGDT